MTCLASCEMEPYSADVLWILIAGAVFSFILAMGIGGNDVPNFFGTSIGSGVLTLKQALFLATVVEMAGAVLLGHKVADTMRKGVLEVSLYEGIAKELMLGCLSTLVASSIWLLVATLSKLPVSGTHSVLGAIIGFSIIRHGGNGIRWVVFGYITLSWLITPICGGVCSLLLFLAIYRFIVTAKDPLKQGYRSLPVFYGLTLFINLVSVLVDRSPLLGLYLIPPWLGMTISIAVSLFVALFVQLVVVPQKRRLIDKQILDKKSHANSTENAKTQSENNKEDEKEYLALLFSFLQILSAGFGGFAHGANDVSNCIAPLVAIYVIYRDGDSLQKAECPIEVLIFGSVGIIFGFWMLGSFVMETIGKNLTYITPTSGFAIESGSAVVVLLASKFGFPISTTHCKVGSVVFVGYISGVLHRKTKRKAALVAVPSAPSVVSAAGPKPKRHKSVTFGDVDSQLKTPQYGVNWSLLRNIVLAWIATFPATMSMSAFIMYAMTRLLLK